MRRLKKYFEEGRDYVNDEYRSGRPASILTNENILRVRQLIEDGPHSTDDDIIAKISLSHGTIERIIHDCLKIRKVTLRYLLINSMTNKSQNDLDFVGKIWQNFEMEHDARM